MMNINMKNRDEEKKSKNTGRKLHVPEYDRIEYMFDGRQIFGFPDEPIAMASMLINATKQDMLNDGFVIVKKKYSKEQLKQIAKHLLIHCEEGKTKPHKRFPIQ